MSSGIVIGAIGAATGIFSAVKNQQNAKKAQQAAQNAITGNSTVSDAVRAQQDALGYQVLAKQEAADQGLNLTPQDQMALDQFKSGIGASNRQIQGQEATAGAGVTNARLLTNQFRQAGGIAGINMQDAATKAANLRTDIGIGTGTPGWANLQTGANTQMAQFQRNLMNQSNQQTQSAYGSAAAGLTALGKLIANQNQGQDQGTVPNQPTNPGIVPQDPTLGMTQYPTQQPVDTNIPPPPLWTAPANWGSDYTVTP